MVSAVPTTALAAPNPAQPPPAIENGQGCTAVLKAIDTHGAGENRSDQGAANFEAVGRAFGCIP